MFLPRKARKFFFNSFINQRVSLKVMVMLLPILIFLSLFVQPLFSLEVSLKDIIKVGDRKKNYFTGYGLVVGLHGTGDRRSLYTTENLKNVLKNHGIKNINQDLRSRNVASVIISAETMGYLNKGDIVDITVASIGDARSIDNGFLIASPLSGGNGKTYLVGSGIVTTEKGHRTRGLIPSGGIVEQNFSNLAFNDYTFPLELRIDNYYSGNILDIKEKIDEDFGDLLNVAIWGEKKLSLSLKDVNAQVSQEKLIIDILKSKLSIETKAKVVIDTELGIIVSGKNIPIDSSYISLPLERERNTFAGSIFNQDYLEEVPEFRNSFQTLGDLFDYFNKRNIEIQDKIPSLLYALRKSGALNAEIILQ